MATFVPAELFVAIGAALTIFGLLAAAVQGPAEAPRLAARLRSSCSDCSSP